MAIRPLFLFLFAFPITGCDQNSSSDQLQYYNVEVFIRSSSDEPIGAGEEFIVSETRSNIFGTGTPAVNFAITDSESTIEIEGFYCSPISIEWIGRVDNYQIPPGENSITINLTQNDESRPQDLMWAEVLRGVVETYGPKFRGGTESDRSCRD